ncbi:hypothetical protein L207DRAFT_1401 [Hyaloscypha variabilis F]|uniref:Uncharacterized protein n=1 Tax=Hyaloscypha variabilis (strain UAMH 11265 / GT02V1 / F) TaxID=1149755 RepID=A0A2J6SBI4_HYAVF|nr:hypothetical protein L207DRAFT_1401 [Hyaloscypha variabilis F]
MHLPSAGQHSDPITARAAGSVLLLPLLTQLSFAFTGAILGPLSCLSCMFLAYETPVWLARGEACCRPPIPHPPPLDRSSRPSSTAMAQRHTSGYITDTRPLAMRRATTPCCVCIALRFVPRRRRCK